MQCTTSADCGWHATCTTECVCEAYAVFTHPVPDVIMGVMSFLIAGISLAAGVGGGGMFVPLLMMFLSFNAKIATALSQSMLLGGAMAAFLYNLDHSHPKAPARPLVDFQLACLMGATLMSGSQIGSVLHAVAPAAVLVFALCVVLIDAARKGVSNALNLQAKEREASASKAVALLDEESSESESDSLEPSSSESSVVLDNEEARARISDAKCKLVCIWIFCVVVVLLRNLVFHVCEVEWWLLVVFSSLALGAFGLYYAFTLSKEVPADENCLDFRELAFPLTKWSFIAGILAAVCGIGGGMVMGPILVGLKVPPPVSSATTATTLLVLSSSMALIYICRGVAPRDYSIYLSVITTFGALTGKVVIGRWVRRTGRESVLVWALAGITIVSTVLMGALGIIRVWQSGMDSLHLGSLCGSPEDQGAGTHAILDSKHHGLACGAVSAPMGNTTL
mmetsp:Transcript_106314/g.328286  ORF Transcript_106314/g.328286 Transcript_106314/m.328286 type:complete len:451 (-) Transcript_106314:305-1657(-)